MSETNGAKYYKNPPAELLAEAERNQNVGGFAYMNSSSKGGKFIVPKKINVTQFVTGDIELDFSLAEFVHPTTEIAVKDFLGGTEITVPKGVTVNTNTAQFLSDNGNNQAADSTVEVVNNPIINVRGFSILGGVEVEINEDVPAITIVE